MKAISTLCAAVVLMSPALHAEDSQQRAKRVLNQCLEALGGAKFMAMRDRVEQGRAYSFYRDTLSGLSVATISTQYLPPSPGNLSLRRREDFGKKKDYGSIIFTLSEAYEVTYRGARPLPQERFDRFKRSMMHDIFYILRERMQEPGMFLQSKGAAVLDNRPVEIVDITDNDNETTTVYIDQTTHLPVRQVFYHWNPIDKEKDEEVTLFTKYRDVNGVQWPFTVERDRNGEKLNQIFAETVQINTNLNDSIFELPTGVKMLKQN